MNSMSHLRVTVFAAALAITGSSHAITINLVDLNGTPPSTLRGAGDLDSVMLAVKDYWEHAFPANPEHTLTLSYQWTLLTGSTLASHSLTGEGGTPHRETSGLLRFDNDRNNWFADDTPFDHSEYSTFTESTDNLGGGVMNTGRQYTGALGVASGSYDLLSVALHEAGHAMGLSSANDAFQLERTDNDVDITSPLPFAGAVIPLNSSTAHTGGSLGATLMWPSVSTSRRTLPSDVDVLMNAEISQFDTVNLTPLPEPAALGLIGLATLGLRRQRRHA